MNNKGQTTVFFTLIICVLLGVTFTAFEVSRIYIGKVKALACVHSMRTSIMADYDRELFERYHLLFMDSTYGTESDGYLEEKILNYLDTSLNGEDNSDGIYTFSIKDIGISNKIGILDNDMEQLKKQIVEYEKTAGVIDGVRKVAKDVKDSSKKIQDAVNETEEHVEKTETNEIDNPGEEGQGEKKVNDPRETLSSMLKGGILSIVMPGNTLSMKEVISQDVLEAYEKQRDTSFSDFGKLKDILHNSIEKHQYKSLEENAAFLNYINTHFSNGVHPFNNTVLQCETEYILEGKSSDYRNMESIANDLIWLRMPVNYAYLLSDSVKVQEAQALALAISSAATVPELYKVIEYLLLGCWAYGESIYDVKDLLAGNRIPYIKTSRNWKTDLESLMVVNSEECEQGLSYEEYLLLLLATKSKKEMEDCYVRMLEVMETNIQQENPDFHISNCVGKFNIQGVIEINPLFQKNQDGDIYKCYINEALNYCED